MAVTKNPSTGLTVDLLGPRVEFLTSPDDERAGFAVLRGTLPAGAVVALHGHPDVEGVVVLSGPMQILDHGPSPSWVTAAPGDYVHLDESSPHAWRTTGETPVQVLIVSDTRLARFLRDVGRPTTPDAALPAPTPEDVLRFVSSGAAYGYYIATPQENAAAGIDLGLTTGGAR